MFIKNGLNLTPLSINVQSCQKIYHETWKIWKQLLIMTPLVLFTCIFTHFRHKFNVQSMAAFIVSINY